VTKKAGSGVVCARFIQRFEEGKCADIKKSKEDFDRTPTKIDWLVRTLIVSEKLVRIKEVNADYKEVDEEDWKPGESFPRSRRTYHLSLYLSIYLSTT